MKVNDFIKKFEELYPLHLAENWDNVGLQIGSNNTMLSSVLLSLDLTKEVVEEAINGGFELIIIHHPLIFSPLKTILDIDPVGELITMLIKNDISLYVAHTNYDSNELGMNKVLADILQLTNQTILEPITETEGLGIVGELTRETSLEAYINHVKDVFNLDSVQLIGKAENTVKTVAITGGSGSSLIDLVASKNVDVYITGDITYHHALNAKALGLNILDVGHNIEQYGFYELHNVIKNNFKNIEVIVSNIDTNPYQKK